MVATQRSICQIYQAHADYSSSYCFLPPARMPPLEPQNCFAVFHQRRKEPTSSCRCVGPTLTASVQHAHNTPLRITHTNYLTLCFHEPGQLSPGQRPGKRGRSLTPLLPLELGSGAQVISQIHKENTIRCMSALKVNCGPGLSADISFLATYDQGWAGTDATDRPSASAPERKTVPMMMGQILPRVPNECLQTKRVGSLRWLLLTTHGLCCVTANSSETKDTSRMWNTRLKYYHFSVQGIVSPALSFPII